MPKVPWVPCVTATLEGKGAESAQNRRGGTRDGKGRSWSVLEQWKMQSPRLVERSERRRCGRRGRKPQTRGPNKLLPAEESRGRKAQRKAPLPERRRCRQRAGQPSAAGARPGDGSACGEAAGAALSQGVEGGREPRGSSPGARTKPPPSPGRGSAAAGRSRVPPGVPLTADIEVVLGHHAAHGAGGRADVGAAVALVEEGEDEDAVGALLQRRVAALLLPQELLGAAQRDGGETPPPSPRQAGEEGSPGLGGRGGRRRWGGRGCRPVPAGWHRHPAPSAAGATGMP